MFDATSLRRTSSSDEVPWRARDVTLIWIRADGRVTQAQGITEKRSALEEAGDEDCLLLAWPGQWRQDVFWIDDRTAALAGLDPHSERG